jgi:hypothetical protein
MDALYTTPTFAKVKGQIRVNKPELCKANIF